MYLNRILKKSQISSTLKKHQKNNETIVFTNGVFDILHRGHVEYLAKAKKLGDVLIVGLNSDTSVRKLKGKGRPLQNQNDRAVILLALKVVDYVIIFGEDTPDKLIKKVKPDILVKGADYKISEIVGADFVKSYGGIVKRITLTRGRSTSSIVSIAQSAECEKIKKNK
ncbi:MAG: D-glycero-beta-D-manno-heptose 1-phosphate adenylyltransferase [bacterium]